MRIPPRKYPTSFHLSLHARTLLRELAQKLGISQASVLEIVIRERAAITPGVREEPYVDHEGDDPTHHP